MAVPSAGAVMALFTVTWIVSPQLAWIKGYNPIVRWLGSSKRRKAYPWVLAVDQEHVLLISIRAYSPPGYRELIRASDASVSSTGVWI